MKSVAVIGTGAVGGYYGIMLERSGLDVHFLLNSDYKRVKEHGLILETAEKTIKLQPVNAWNSPNEMPECDLVLITLKATFNHLLAEYIPKVCHSKSKILVLQNGLDTDKDAAEAVPENEIFGGLCSIACNKIGPGHIRHINFNEIRMGQYLRNNLPAGITESLEELSQLFNKAGVDTVLSENITEARWRKIVWNITFNGLTTVLDCTTKEIMENPDYRKRAIKILNEAVSAANSCGMNIEMEFVDRMVQLTDSMNPYKPSMKLDFENNRPLELEVIYQRPIDFALKNGCNIPEIEKLFRELIELENKKGRRTDGHTHR